MEKLLSDQRFLITRPILDPAKDELGRLIQESGGQLRYEPAIKILKVAQTDQLDDCLRRANEFGGFVFLSRNAVQAVFERLEQLGIETSSLTGLAWFAIGSGTQQELGSFLRSVHCRTPAVSNSTGMADLLLESPRSGPFLIFRGNRGSTLLPDRLGQAGIAFRQLVVYQSADATTLDSGLAEQLKGGDFDWITVTSSAIATAVCRLYAPFLKQLKVASISPQTTSRLLEFGIKPTVEAKQHDAVGLFDAIQEYVSSAGTHGNSD